MKAPACQHNTRRLIRAITQSRDIGRKASSHRFAKALRILFVGRIGLRLGFGHGDAPDDFCGPGWSTRVYNFSVFM
jgi:hypothetical protein